MNSRLQWIASLLVALLATGCGSTPGDGHGDSGPCTPSTCEGVGAECGQADDGCGGTLLCGTCTVEGEMCGGDVTRPNQCSVCVPNDSCEVLGYECGVAVDPCGNTYDCAEQGLGCGAFQICQGRPARCVDMFEPGECDLCPSVPSCDGPGEEPTRLSGRVVTPGRNNGDTANHVGVPNAFVYILRNNDPSALPPIPTGIPTGGTSCDRCEDQDLGPILAGAITDATGAFTIEGNVPVGAEFVLVVKIGKFRRAVQYQLDSGAACQTTNLPTDVANNPVRLPRQMNETGAFGIHIPRIAVSTGQIDAMECVFFKMGLDSSQFGNPGSDGNSPQRVHLYRGGASGSPAGAHMGSGTPHHSALYGSSSRLQSYDMVVANCEGPSWGCTGGGGGCRAGDPSEDDLEHVREYVNRGGRMFASHLSFKWLYENGTAPYTSANPIETGLDDAVTWISGAVTSPDSGPGRVSHAGRSHVSDRIGHFTAWMIHHGVIASAASSFDIIEPRSQVSSLGDHSEEFVYCESGSGGCSGTRTQQLSFDTPYADVAEDAACGRVAYSGFHVSSGGDTDAYVNQTFPNHCQSASLGNDGVLTDQEKVLLYMLFDLGACVGEPPGIPQCTPLTCEGDYPQVECGFVADGCGGILDCGDCPEEGVECGGTGVPYSCGGCLPTTCAAEGAQCGSIPNGCGAQLNCGTCPTNQICTGSNTCQFVG
jgi:hypothetical protein